ncbi:hypothetical protein IVB40_07665 [Bradyrhizobium sp. 40]|uniref:sialate O-acetylesterase n=1 Tax=Bradyrhizobium sp. 40 TaxID=2782674 RepID=UPI001FFF3CCE|nr:sialate O-acetylesterase [Bradyrhizobium sp. 40]UPJ43937.1 hypothetical protein IVB40_07665 [Bradyrhizobium sp. 40]
MSPAIGLGLGMAFTDLGTVGIAPLPPPVPVGTTLDPAGATANNVLSNGNLTVSGASNPQAFVRSIKSITSGKYECAFTIGAVGSGMSVGCADTTLSLSVPGGSGLANSTLAVGYFNTGVVYCGSGFTNIDTLASYTTGDVIRLRIDRSTSPGTVCFSKNGGAFSTPRTMNAAMTHALHVGVGHQGGGASATVDFDPTGKGSGYSGWTDGTPIDVIVTAGQSNAVAQQLDQSWPYPVNPNIITWNGSAWVTMRPGTITGYDFGATTGKWAADVELSRQLFAVTPTKRIAHIRYPASGSQLAPTGDGTFDWSEANELFANGGFFVRDAMAALRAAGYNPTIILLWWQQGETDATASTPATNYGTNFATLVAGFRNQSGDWKIPAACPIAVGRLSSQFGSATNRNLVRAGQKSVCDADVGGPQWLVECDDLALENDQTHFVRVSHITLAGRLKQVIAGTYTQPTNTP